MHHCFLLLRSTRTATFNTWMVSPNTTVILWLGLKFWSLKSNLNAKKLVTCKVTTGVTINIDNVPVPWYSMKNTSTLKLMQWHGLHWRFSPALVFAFALVFVVFLQWQKIFWSHYVTVKSIYCYKNDIHPDTVHILDHSLWLMWRFQFYILTQPF